MGRAATFLLAAAFFGSSVFAQRVPIKNVAVIETQIDDRSGAADDINRAEVGVITNEIRREAVNNLPRNRFNIMTTETVQAMGDAILEDCAEENCVIALGSKIGADYIVRGIISKLRQDFILTVEMYETDYGMLVATADPVRSASVEELYEKSALACASMYKKFLESSPPAVPQTVAVPESGAPRTVDDVMADGRKRIESKPEEPKKSSPLKLTVRVSAAALTVGGFVGGVVYERKANSEHRVYDNANGLQEMRDARKNAKNFQSTGNVFYTVGCIGLSAFTLTFFF